MSKKSIQKRGIILPSVEWILKITTWFSLYRWITALLRKRGIWEPEGETPLWFPELYVLVFLLTLSLIYWFIPESSVLWLLGLYIGGYRLLDLMHSLSSILVFESQRLHDDEGGYIVTRIPIRWLLLTILNLGEILLYFSFFYLKLGKGFKPQITTKISAFHESTSVFIAGGGSAPTTNSGQILVTGNLLYFVFFLILVAPMILSAFRIKQQKPDDILSTEPDIRL